MTQCTYFPTCLLPYLSVHILSAPVNLLDPRPRPNRPFVAAELVFLFRRLLFAGAERSDCCDVLAFIASISSLQSVYCKRYPGGEKVVPFR